MNTKPKQQNKLLESYNVMQEKAEKNGLNQEILDKEEKELIEAIESDNYQFGESNLTPERTEFLRQAAKNTMSKQK